MKQLEKELKALANQRRLSICKFLKRDREATVGEISDYIKLSFKSTSRHLAILYNAGILNKEQRGLDVYYHLPSNHNRAVKNVLASI